MASVHCIPFCGMIVVSLPNRSNEVAIRPHGKKKQLQCLPAALDSLQRTVGRNSNMIFSFFRQCSKEAVVGSFSGQQAER